MLIIARRLLNYLRSSGSFKSAADLSKIYGMESPWLNAASEYVEIQPLKESLNPELNNADSVSLMQLPWVGPFYASEIIKLRNSLGGFRSYTQLLDIYKIRDETFESFIEHTTLDTALLEKVNINLVDLKRLGYHPYLTWKQARIIVNYREQHGNFESIKEILNTRVISDSVYVKIAPYLTTKE
jgi:competence protein ComEA